MKSARRTKMIPFWTTRLPGAAGGLFEKGTQRGSVQGWLWFWLGLSLALKIFLVLKTGQTYNLRSDDQSYVTTANIWLKTGRFTYNDPSKPTVFIMPVYPAFLALFMQVFGAGEAMVQAVRVAQAVVVTAGFYVLFLIGRHVYSERAGLWAVALCAWYPPFWLMSDLLLTESLFTFTVLWMVYAGLMLMETFSWKWAVSFAFAWVAGLYLRPVMALWPGVFLVLLLCWRQVPWQVLLKRGSLVALILIVCMMPWWVRNAQVSGGQVIWLTRSSGNPLLLGTFPYGIPNISVQRTWHQTNDLWANDAFDRAWAMHRIRDGFRNRFWLYLSWYTVGKFAFLWGEVFYWLPVAGLPKEFVWGYHHLLLLPGVFELWVTRKKRGVQMIAWMLIYVSVLYMVYLTHARYAIPFMPLVALFAARFYERHVTSVLNWEARE